MIVERVAIIVSAIVQVYLRSVLFFRHRSRGSISSVVQSFKFFSLCSILDSPESCPCQFSDVEDLSCYLISARQPSFFFHFHYAGCPVVSEEECVRRPLCPVTHVLSSWLRQWLCAAYLWHRSRHLHLVRRCGWHRVPLRMPPASLGRRR